MLPQIGVAGRSSQEVSPSNATLALESSSDDPAADPGADGCLRICSHPAYLCLPGFRCVPLYSLRPPVTGVIPGGGITCACSGVSEDSTLKKMSSPTLGERQSITTQSSFMTVRVTHALISGSKQTSSKQFGRTSRHS